MNRYFLSGLAILLPIALTVGAVFFVIDLLTAPFTDIIHFFIAEYGGDFVRAHYGLLTLAIRSVILLVSFFLIFLLGFLGNKIFFSKITELTRRILTKIPFIKTVYKITSDITEALFSRERKRLFQKTVLIPFPSHESYASGLHSGTPAVAIANRMGWQPDHLDTLFIPTSPYPVSGFVIIYEKKEVETVDMKTEELFAFLLSCGTINATEKRSDPGSRGGGSKI
ncbi:MAG: DUF502 domain-containing protein [Simkaniaceae bacterium]|nr:DUF502 domain-containing protein [Simkaniaceae bacterium]